MTDSAGTVQTVTATVAADGSYHGDVPLPLAEGGYAGRTVTLKIRRDDEEKEEKVKLLAVD